MLIGSNSAHSDYTPYCACLQHVPQIVTLDSMKFPRPRTLQQNEFPDNISTQPVLFQNLVQNIIHPPENSAMDSYINASIEYLKAQHRLKAKSACLNVTNLESTLYFVNVSFPPSTFKIKCLVDTGASHTIIHHNIISRLNIVLYYIFTAISLHF